MSAETIEVVTFDCEFFFCVGHHRLTIVHYLKRRRLDQGFPSSCSLYFGESNSFACPVDTLRFNAEFVPFGRRHLVL